MNGSCASKIRKIEIGTIYWSIYFSFFYINYICICIFKLIFNYIIYKYFNIFADSTMVEHQPLDKFVRSSNPGSS